MCASSWLEGTRRWAALDLGIARARSASGALGRQDVLATTRASIEVHRKLERGARSACCHHDSDEPAPGRAAESVPSRAPGPSAWPITGYRSRAVVPPFAGAPQRVRQSKARQDQLLSAGSKTRAFGPHESPSHSRALAYASGLARAVRGGLAVVADAAIDGVRVGIGSRCTEKGWHHPVLLADTDTFAGRAPDLVHARPGARSGPATLPRSGAPKARHPPPRARPPRCRPAARTGSKPRLENAWWNRQRSMRSECFATEHAGCTAELSIQTASGAHPGGLKCPASPSQSRAPSRPPASDKLQLAALREVVDARSVQPLCAARASRLTSC